MCCQSVRWYLSTFPLCCGEYGAVRTCSIPLYSRNFVNHGQNSIPQSVRIFVIGNGDSCMRLSINSILDRTQCSVWSFEYTNLEQSSIASYWTALRFLPNGKQTSTCTSLPGVSSTYKVFLLFLHSHLCLYRTWVLLRIRYIVDWLSLIPVCSISFKVIPTGQSSGNIRAILPIVSSILISVLFIGIPFFGQHFFGSKPTSHSIRYFEIHFDTDCLDTESISATSLILLFFERISLINLILIWIKLKHRYLVHMSSMGYGLSTSILLFFIFRDK